MYWTGAVEDRPPYLNACLETVRKNSGCHVLIVDEAQAARYIPALHPAFPKLTPNHQSDVFRLNMLYLFGGMYIDFDTIVMKSLRPLFDQLNECEFIGADWRPHRLERDEWGALGTGVMGPCHPGLRFLERCIVAQNAVLDDRYVALCDGTDYPILWGDLLSFVGATFAAHRPTARLKDGASTWFSLVGSPQWLGGDLGHALRKATDVEELPESELFTLANASIPEAYRKMSLSDILKTDTILAELFKKALR